MRLALPRAGRLGLRIRSKFLLVFALLVPALFAVPAVGLHGLSAIRDEAASIYSDNVDDLRSAQNVARGIEGAYALALRIIPAGGDDARLRRLDGELATEVIPRVTADLDSLREAHANDPLIERAGDAPLAEEWRRFVRLWASGAFNTRGLSPAVARRNEATAQRVGRILRPMTAMADRLVAVEAAQASHATERAAAQYRSSRSRVLLLAAGAVALCLSALLWLIRDIVPRVRDYSRFAARVASSATAEPIETHGSDELSELGRRLNEMVRRSMAEVDYRDSQAEFAAAMQGTESEQEAHALLKRHIERSIPTSEVLVLNRNNSRDRLEPTTALALDSPLQHALRDATPRSCLAVRFAGSHEEGNGRSPLLECEICAERAAERAVCEPLLVGGEVIGAVLVQHVDPLGPEDDVRIRSTVVQAAPVLANLRNLAIAELRASTDALTGLPNNRSVQENMKRMVAHAMRTSAPLTVALLDLDHFKQINDGFGHGKGDEVLANVAAILQEGVRESDFVGRLGGEEFLILMPGADRDGALVATEKLRDAIAGLTVVGLDRPITGSLGFAVLPEDGADVATLTRNADRALYTAKALGRNRVEAFGGDIGAAGFEPATSRV